MEETKGGTHFGGHIPTDEEFERMPVDRYLCLRCQKSYGVNEVTSDAAPSNPHFDITTTGDAHWDEILADPGRALAERGKKSKIAYMSPEQFFATIQRIEGHDPRWGMDPGTAREYADKMRAGEVFPMPVMDNMAIAAMAIP